MGSSLAPKLKFDSVYEVSASGFVGVLILLWNSASLNLVVTAVSDQCIHTKISGVGLVFLSSFVYVQPCTISKSLFWDALKLFAASVSHPWIVIGDFNDFALLSERKGGSGNCLNRILKSREIMDACNLSDPGCVAGTFTWVRKINGRVTITGKVGSSFVE